MSWMLPRLVGVTRANDLLLSGRVVTGAETADWGLWNGVLPDGAGDARRGPALRRRAGHRRSGRPPLRTTKRQIYDDLLRHDVGAALDDARRLLVEAMTTAEYREGVAAFRERRPPRF